MNLVKDFLKAANYRVRDGFKFEWDCYGPKCIAITCSCGDLPNTSSCEIIFNPDNDEVFEIQCWPRDGCNTTRPHRAFLKPKYKKAYIKESEKRGFDWEIAYDGINFEEVDVDKIMKLIRKEFRSKKKPK